MTLQELENSISQMSPDELAKFRTWFLRFDGNRFDEKIEADIKNGNLDKIADAAIAEHKKGDSSPL